MYSVCLKPTHKSGHYVSPNGPGIFYLCISAYLRGVVGAKGIKKIPWHPRQIRLWYPILQYPVT